MELGAQVSDYLKGINPEHWCVFTSIGNALLYGWRTSNFIESMFGSQMIMNMRLLYPFAFFQAVCNHLVDECFTRPNNCRIWKAKGVKRYAGFTHNKAKMLANTRPETRQKILCMWFMLLQDPQLLAELLSVPSAVHAATRINTKFHVVNLLPL